MEAQKPNSGAAPAQKKNPKVLKYAVSRMHSR